jgi:DNA-binding NarL/FixJ family response regulator
MVWTKQFAIIVFNSQVAKGCGMSTQKTALVIDDHPLVARGIADFLKSHCDFSQVEAVTDTTSLWNKLELSDHPTIILVDFWLPSGASLPLLGELKAKYPQIHLLVISADENAAVEDKVRSAGAQGFINKQAAPEVFVLAVNAILSGNTYFSNTTFNHAKFNDTYQPNQLPVTAKELGLTARQGEILAMIIQGLPNKRIAQVLSLSEQTVKEHVSGILSRLGVNNRIEAITKLRGKRLE